MRNLPGAPSGHQPLSAGFVIGEWTVLPSRNVLERPIEQVRLEPRVMDVLVRLAERAGEPVSKDELTELVWKSQYISDEALTATIYALRKALRDDARHPRYIETVSRRGYRLIAPVKPLSQPVAKVDSDAGPHREAHPARRHFLRPVAVGAIVVLCVGAIGMLVVGRTSRHVPTPEAREAYLRGRYLLDQRSIEGWQQALEHFRRAVALDPKYPAVHAGLADTYAAMSDFGVRTPAEMRPLAVQAAQRALALDARSAEAHAALGRVQFLFDWDFDAAERSLERALALDPEYMPAHQTMAWLKSSRGEHARAVAAARRALQLDPVNTARYTELAWVLTLDKQYQEALRELDRALQLSPRSLGTYLMKGWVWEVAGEPDTALAAYRAALRIGGAPESWLNQLDSAYRERGLTGFYRLVANRRTGGTPLSDTWRAQMYVRAGELDRAVESLQRAYARRESALAWVNVEPTFRPLRSDVRFQQIAAGVTRGH